MVLLDPENKTDLIQSSKKQKKRLIKGLCVYVVLCGFAAVYAGGAGVLVLLFALVFSSRVKKMVGLLDGSGNVVW